MTISKMAMLALEHLQRKIDISGGNIKLTNTNSPFGAGLYSNNNVYLGGNQYLDITAGV